MAEMSLHRTPSDQVATVFKELRKVAPTPAAIVENQGSARRAMRSFGLRLGADNIIAVARVLVKRHGGRVPQKKDELLALPGVGDYLANAVLAFGFGRRAILMNTNTTRVIRRYTGRPSGHPWQMRIDLYHMAGRTGPDADFNSALLDLGALVCRVGKPSCEACPLRNSCAHNLNGTG
jgi:A/G-specific adenine glycosylase